MARYLFFYKRSGPTVGPNQTHIQRVPETSAPSSGGSSPSGAKVTNGVVSPRLYMHSFPARVRMYHLPFYLDLNSVIGSGSAHLNQKQEIFVCKLTRLVHSAR